MKLVLAIDLIRHADRTSVHHVPGISKDLSQDDMGQLTLEGEKNAIKLGEKLKHYYIKEHSLLSSSYEPDTILIKSSDFQRTKETAKCIIKGMYQSKSETVEINILPKQQDLLFLGFLYAPGQEMQNLLRSQYAASTKLPKEIIHEINLELDKINTKFGTNFSDISDIVKIADVIKTDSIHEKFSSEKINSKEITKILHLTKLVFKDVFESPNVAYAGAGTLMEEVIKQMADKMQNMASLKYILLSGHDTNILAAMSLLDLPLVEVPYLANLRFELFQNNNDFFVKVFCIDEYVQIYSEEYCPFGQFEVMLQDKLNKKYSENIGLN